MSAFPASPASGTLGKARDDLREVIQTLQSSLACASAFVEALESDRINRVGVDASDWFSSDAAFDAAYLSIAQTLLTQLSAEASNTSTSSLWYRIRNTLSIQE